MAKLNKKLMCDKSTQEIIQISRGISSLFHVFIADKDEEFSNEVLSDIFKVVNLQKDLLDEIETRLPSHILESAYNKEKVSNELVKTIFDTISLSKDYQKLMENNHKMSVPGTVSTSIKKARKS